MRRPLLLVALLSACALRAGPPAALANALEFLRDQHSYSWEIINADPAPTVQQFETRRGTITNVAQSLSPHVKGRVDSLGNVFLQRDWIDGVQLDTVIAADGTAVTHTPEGWMTEREILNALADERVQNNANTERMQWLRRADRPSVVRPDQELVPFLKFEGPVQHTGDSYIIAGQVRSDVSSSTDAEDAPPPTRVTFTLNLSGGVIRDYEVEIEGSRAASAGRTRVRVPVRDHRIVVLTYVPVTRLDIPDEAREKLGSAKLPARRDAK